MKGHKTETMHSCADRLMSVEKRRWVGAYYTPEPFTSIALDYLERTLGSNWQEEYYIWDCCCGTGNLEFGLKSYSKLFMSTLEKEEIDQLINDNIFPKAELFKFDFLNDARDKLPDSLLDVLDSKKKIVFLINPPYADAGSGIKSNKEETKPNVANSLFKKGIRAKYGKAANELFIQFIGKIQTLAPHAVIAIFSKTKMYNGTDFEKFRNAFNGQFDSGFIFHCKAFVMAKGAWPVSFSILVPKTPDSLGLNQTVSFDVLNEYGEVIGKKSFVPCNKPLSMWFKRPKDTVQSVPLTGAITVKTDKVLHDKIASKALGYMDLSGNDLTQSQACFLASSAINHGHGTSVVPENFSKAVVSLGIRHIIPHTWTNDRDQFSLPDNDPDDDFYNGCLIWLLFSPQNQTSSFTATYKGSNRFIDNQWFPFSKKLASKYGPQKYGFQSFVEMQKESFVFEYLHKCGLTDNLKEILNDAESIYIIFYRNYERLNLEKYRIENYRAGWWQIRNALEEGGYAKNEMNALKEKLKNLRKKLEEGFYRYGFFPRDVDKEIQTKKSITLNDYGEKQQ